MSPRVYRIDEEVDFVIVGAGAAGGVMAKELSTAGFDVVVLEQGPWWKQGDFKHDEYGAWILMNLCGGLKDSPQSYRKSETEEAQPATTPPAVLYAHGVAGRACISRPTTGASIPRGAAPRGGREEGVAHPDRALREAGRDLGGKQKAEGRKQKAESRRQKAEGRKQKAESREQ